MHDTSESDVTYMYACFIGKCIITMYYIFELWDLMYVVCHKYGRVLYYVLYKRIYNDTIHIPFLPLVSGNVSVC